MPRALNPDGTPWWVSTGPPLKVDPQLSSNNAEPAAEPQPAQATSETPRAEQPSSQTGNPMDAINGVLGSIGVTPEVQAAAINSGLNLLTGVMNLVSTPLNGKAETSVHVVATCGVCPLCMAVAALREHDEGLADLVESALAGVTSSIEKLSGMVPGMIDNISEVFVEAIVRSVLHKSRP